LAVGVAAEVKSKLNSSVDVGRETVQLKKAGTTLKGLCPFHGEKTPSFIVTPGRETCIASVVARPVTSFLVRDAPGWDRFPEALRRLAQRAGVEIDERTRARMPIAAASTTCWTRRSPSTTRSSSTARRARRRLPTLRGRGSPTSRSSAPSSASRRRTGMPWSGPWSASARSGRPKLIEAGLATPAKSGRVSTTASGAGWLSRSGDATGPNATGLGRGRICPRHRRRRSRYRIPLWRRPAPDSDRPQVPQLARHAAVRQERTLYPLDRAKAAIRKSGSRDRGGLHGRAHGPPSRLRERGRQPRHRADAGPVALLTR